MSIRNPRPKLQANLVRRLGRKAKPRLEALEGRELLSTIIVNTIKDQIDPPGSSTISLRDAVGMANSSLTATTIEFDSKVFATHQTITLNAPRLIFQNANEPISIVGPAQGVTISGNNTTGVFVIWSNTTASLTGMTVTGGRSTNGAGVDNYGTVTLTQMTITGNNSPNGGGVYTSHLAILIDDTISNNSGVTGGGIWNSDGGYLTLTNVTIAGNTASYGGGILNGGAGGGTTELHNVTIAHNTATYGGGGVFNYSGDTVGTANSIIADNNVVGTTVTSSSGPDVSGTFASRGYNLIGKTNGSTGWTSADQTGTIAHPLDPRLSPLNDYGGPTQTLVPLWGSPAIDHGSNSLLGTVFTTDQRGLPRIVNGRIDVGAVETQPLVVNTTSDLPSGASAFGTMSLRQAIWLANVESTATTITFDTHVFATKQSITLDGSRLIIENSAAPITIIGPSAGVYVNGNNASGDFVIWTSTTASLSNITATGGKSGNGAGVDNYGRATLTNMTIAGNSAPNGGGVFSNGLLIMLDDTIAYNTGVTGGGLWNQGSGYASLTNVTIAGNTATYGGGIYNGGTGSSTTTLHNVTIADNTASVSGGGVYNATGGVVSPGNTIIAANVLAKATSDSGPDVFGSFSSKGYNLIGVTNGSTGWVSSDQTGTFTNPLNPLLGPLADNGGPTLTLLPQSGSPAIDHGSIALVPAGLTTDQRGFKRIVNGTVDVGAVEVQD